MMPTSVTLGKCSPLAIICVPMRMSILPARKACSVSRKASLRAIASASMRLMTACGNTLPMTSSTRSVPSPACRIAGSWHFGQREGHGCLVAAQVADQPVGRPMKRQRDAAILAPADVAAGRADQRRGESPAVQEQDRLLLLDEPLVDGGAQLFREHERAGCFWRWASCRRSTTRMSGIRRSSTRMVSEARSRTCPSWRCDSSRR